MGIGAIYKPPMYKSLMVYRVGALLPTQALSLRIAEAGLIKIDGYFLLDI